MRSNKVLRVLDEFVEHYLYDFEVPTDLKFSIPKQMSEPVYCLKIYNLDGEVTILYNRECYYVLQNNNSEILKNLNGFMKEAKIRRLN